ncbi:PetM family of cytochrome b6f complex subunit 7 [Bosea thiooxidans]|nr:PetM family of cytochrome b6f complex subunit 7 [Bosea sp. (in: a-proteobacteria)]
MRFLVRCVGYLLVAAGFVVLVIDGARSIANAFLRFTTVGDVLAAVLHERYRSLGPMIERNLHPLLWDPVLLSVTQAPAALAALVLGFVLLWLGRPPEPQIGIVTRR